MHHPRIASTQSGATMIEVLVALFVLSVGLLGVAAMQQVSLRNSHSSQMRAQATALAYDIADRMRANRFEAVRDPSPYGVGLGPAPAATCSTAAPGDPALQAGCDLVQWKQALAGALPEGDGSVTIEPMPAPGVNQVRVATIVVQWRDRADGGGFGTMSFETRTQL